MKSFRRQTLADQAADYLRNAIASQRWETVLPGIRVLTAELKVSRTCLDRALAMLTSEGLIEPGAVGHPRRIVKGVKRVAPKKISKVGFLLDSPLINLDGPTRETVFGISVALEDKGLEVVLSRKTLKDLPQPRSLLPGLVASHQADCWLVLDGSRDVLQWFSEQKFPCLALGGRTMDLSIATVGYELPPIVEDATKRLIAAGHQRIVMPLPQQWQSSSGPSRSELAFRAQMEAAKLRVGPFNLPEWDKTPGGWMRLIDELFSFTPPTAFIIHSMPMFIALQSALMERGLRIPGDVSVILTASSPSLEWVRPAVDHYDRASAPFIKAAIDWVLNLKPGAKNEEKVFLRAVYREGGSIAPVGRGAKGKPASSDRPTAVNPPGRTASSGHLLPAD